MPFRVINVLGVSHADKTHLAQQLAIDLRARGHEVLCLPDPWFDHWQLTGRVPEAEGILAMLAQSHKARQDALGSLGERDALCVQVQPCLNLWAMSACLGYVVGDLASIQRDQQGDFMTLLLAAPSGPARAHDVSCGISASLLEDELRRALYRAELPYVPLWGEGAARQAQALMVIEHALDEPARLTRASRGPRWRWLCDNCDDGGCEHATLNLPGR